MPSSLPLSVGLPVKDGGRQFQQLAAHLIGLQDRYDVEVVMVDSGSTDGTLDVGLEAGFRVHQIPPEHFGFGRTRNLIARMATREVLAWVSADALPVTPQWPELFCEALEDERVAGVYGRQVPRDASTMEMFFVSQNYPAEPLRYDPAPGDSHHPRPGRVLFSNVFGAVRRDLLRRHPYPETGGMSEDQYFAHWALDEGYVIEYEPEAEALHAHDYSLRGLFRRTFQVGRSLRGYGLDQRSASFLEGVRYLGEEVDYFVRHGHAHRLPELLAHEFTRWAGFQVGRATCFRSSIVSRGIQ